MSLTVIVTRDVPMRFRGFLASVALEIAPGVYTAPRMNAAVRKRVWTTLEQWFSHLGRGGVVMTWADASHPSGQQVVNIGIPPRFLVQLDGHTLAHRHLSGDDQALLESSD